MFLPVSYKCSCQMASSLRKLTEKGQEYHLEVKFKALGETWRSIKTVSEERRLSMAEGRSIREAKVLYTKSMNLHEACMQANDDYCFIVSEDGRKDHFDAWFNDKDVFKCEIKGRRLASGKSR